MTFLNPCYEFSVHSVTRDVLQPLFDTSSRKFSRLEYCVGLFEPGRSLRTPAPPPAPFECRSLLNVWEPHQHVSITPLQTVDATLCKIIPSSVNTVTSMIILTVEKNISTHYAHIIHAGEWCVLKYSYTCAYTEMFHYAGCGSPIRKAAVPANSAMTLKCV